MKIVYTTHQFFPDYSSGTEVLTLKTAQEMIRHGHEVYIFTGYPVKGTYKREEAFTRYKYEGIPVCRFLHSNTYAVAPDNPMEAEYNNLFFADFFRRQLTEIKPDVVHFYHLQRLSVSAIDVCSELGIPMVFTATDFWLVCPTNQMLMSDCALCKGPNSDMTNCLRHMVAILRRQTAGKVMRYLPDYLLSCLMSVASNPLFQGSRYARLLRALSARPTHIEKRMNRLDNVLIATKFMGEILHRYGLKSEKMKMIPFGIDFSEAGLPSAKGKENVLRIGFIGTLYYHKGAHILLKAVRSLPVSLPLQVNIYGSLHHFPEYAAYLHSIVGDDSRINFSGTFPPEAIWKILHELDILVVPSLWYENTPLVIHSAQAAKVPVVATDIGGINEIIHHGRNGLLFERGNAEALSRIIRTLCCNRADVETLSRQAVPPKPLADYAYALEQIYAEVANGW